MYDDRLILALDVHAMEDVKSLVETLGDSVTHYKVGMELFYSVGAPVVSYLKEKGKQVFLDLKLHDIPNTVAGGLCSLMGLGADILNVHASGGYAMMKKSAEALRAAAEKQGLAFAAEVFADRAYEDDGSLVSRTKPGAMIENEDLAIRRMLRLVESGVIESCSGREIRLEADTICVHGDSPKAVLFAKKLREALL